MVKSFSSFRMFKEVKDLQDIDLLKRYKGGDTIAYDILFKRYYAELYNYAFKNVRNTFIAEELTMDVMLGLWKKQGDIHVDVNLKAYLYRSVKNAIYNHYRKKILATVSLDEEIDANVVQSRPADDAIIYSELEKIYHQKLSELSPARRKVYQMSREENKTYAEIAKDMNLSINTVENYMVAALGFFKQHIKEHADFTLFILIVSISKYF
ncbi:RNA polymerase sigma-70 factor [Pedobacter nototheniae]|uniref:RNA polymerase sigma factor n=1 Tax=Pedobacter nototheniae TaxID=2488994 RepID=UPI00292CF9CF|nr:RNA polymerase sigma-70 factor [Pedobacter nototheniae]